MAKGRNLTLALFCLLLFVARSTGAAAYGGKDLRRAEAVLEKLRRLEAAGPDAGAFREAAAGLYPELFVSVSELRKGELRTELATAAALFETASRLRGAGRGAADCGLELRESYLRACLEGAGGGRAGVLRAKAALHLRRAEAELRRGRGGQLDEATLRVLSQLRAERETDVTLAEETLSVLKELSGRLGEGHSFARAAGGRTLAGESEEPAAVRFAGRLGAVDQLLSSLPRDEAHTALKNARDSFADGLYWESMGAPGRSLVVNASSLAAPDPLRRVGLDEAAAARASRANLQASQKFIRRAEAAIAAARLDLNATVQ